MHEGRGFGYESGAKKNVGICNGWPQKQRDNYKVTRAMLPVECQ